MIGAVAGLGIAVLAAAFVVAASRRASPSADVAAPEASPSSAPSTAPATGSSATDGRTGPAGPPWVTYTPPDGTFQVDFPGRPTADGGLTFVDATRSHYIQTLQLLYAVGAGGDGLEVDASTLSEGRYGADAEEAFGRYVASDPLRSGWRRTGPTTLGGAPAVEFVASPDRGRPVRGVLTSVGSTVYVLIGTGLTDADYERFLASFRLRSGGTGR